MLSARLLHAKDCDSLWPRKLGSEIDDIPNTTETEETSEHRGDSGMQDDAVESGSFLRHTKQLGSR